MMIKRAFLGLLFVLAFSATLFSQGLAADEELNPPPSFYIWTWFPWFRWAAAPPPLPPNKLPAPPQPAPPQIKCLESFTTQTNCLDDILRSFVQLRPNLGDDCCAAIKATHDDCLNTILDQFNNPLFATLLKEYCFNKEGAKSPPARA
ncbi:hypothetical protein REPUB_Repub06bG0073600 [Reevesia pubescens]